MIGKRGKAPYSRRGMCLREGLYISVPLEQNLYSKKAGLAQWEASILSSFAVRDLSLLLCSFVTVVSSLSVVTYAEQNQVGLATSPIMKRSAPD